MGHQLLNNVLRWLREAGFAVREAYPGQKFFQISGTVAAVRLEQTDRSKYTMTLEIQVLCPASMGGTTCELEAVRVVEVLHQHGAVCVQSGCRYEGVTQVYMAPVLATFSGTAVAENWAAEPGFQVFFNDVEVMHAKCIATEAISGVQEEYAMGQVEPVGIYEGQRKWILLLEEWIPAGEQEQAEPADGFELKIRTTRKTEIYQDCYWRSIRREFTPEGLKKVREGMSLGRREV